MTEIGRQTTRSSGPSNSVTHVTANGNASVHVGNNYNLPKDDYLEALWVTDPKMDKERIENAKGGLHTASYAWILRNRDFQTLRENPESHLLWIKGDPGKGKTMLLCGIINELTSSTLPETLIAYFFCQAADERLNNATAVLRGLICMLIEQNGSLGIHVRERMKGAGKRLFEGPNSWFVLENIFMKMLKDAGFKSAYIIVDALDECEEDLERLIGLVKRTVSSRIKWIMSSRHRDGIEHDLQLAGPRARLSLELKENAEEVNKAVDTYIDHCVSKLVNLYDQETRDQLGDMMRQKAHGTFLWVSLVFQEIGKARLLRRELEDMMNQIPVTLEGLYLRMIKQIRKLDRQRPELCRKLLATVVTALRPLQLEELGVVSDLSGEYAREIEHIASLCRSFLTIQGQTVSIIHQSAKDFLCTNEFLFPFGNMAETHGTIVSTSLHAMSKTLRRDTYNLGCIGKTINEVKPPKEDQLASIRYSCIFWADHLDEGLSAIEGLAQKSNQPPGDDGYYAKISAQFNNILQDNGAIYQFLMESYLFWLEALSLLQSIPEGIMALEKLEEFLESRTGNMRLLEFVRDARRFCLQQSSVMTKAPLQVYASALLFSPRQSIVRKQFEDRELQWITIKPHVEDYWNPCLATVVVDDDHVKAKVKSVTFSPDGRLIATTSDYDEVKVWRADTGDFRVRIGDEYGMIPYVMSAQFSPCGKRIAIRSLKGISLWCIETGSCQMTFDSQGSPVYSMVFSPDGAHISLALGYVGNIEIRDIPTRECLPTLRISRDSSDLRTTWFEREGVTRASFSPNGQVLAVRSQNIQLWDTFTGVCQMTLNTHAAFIPSVVLSEDGIYVAAISENGAVELWDLQTGVNQQMCRNHSEIVLAVAFSPDGRNLASGSSDYNVYLWDLQTGSCLGTLAGHDDLVNCVAFSPDSQRLVSGSEDSTFRIWDLKDSGTQTAIKDRNGRVKAIFFSPDNRHVALFSEDDQVKLRNTSTGKCLITTSGDTETLFTANNQHFIKFLVDSSIEVWDLATYDRRTFNMDGFPRSPVSSPDGRKLAYIRWDNYGDRDVYLLDIEIGKHHKVAHLKGYWGFNRLSFHSTGKYVVFEDGDNTFKHVWDISDNPSERPLKDQGMDEEEYTSYYPKVRLEVLPPEDQHLTTAILDASVANCGLSNDGRWITYRGQNKILLPYDYEGSLIWESEDNMIAIAGKQGDVIIIGFGDDVP